jgi:hypothetical protein
MNIFEKLCRIQNELKAPKDQKNTYGGFNYRNAEGILQALKPLCLKHESTILLTDSIEVIEGRFFIKTIAELISWDVDGETAGKVVSAPGWAEFPTQKKGMDLAQMTGTASSYAKKRALESLFGLSNEKDSDAYNNNDTEAEKQEAMERNQEKLDAVENWRLTNDGIEVKGQNGFVPVSKLSVAQLQVIVKMKKFEGIKADLEREIASR